MRPSVADWAAWMPESDIGNSLETGELKVLPLKEGVERFVDLHLIYADGQYAGQAARYLEEQIRLALPNPVPASRFPDRPIDTG